MNFPHSILLPARRTLHKKVLSWYRATGRPLPWRATTDPYRILVSEVMLQQTQVSRVLVKFPQFIKEFSSFRTLAKASPGSVLRVWKGMGYYNRAIRLRNLAIDITKNPRGKLPESVEGLAKLPGIGPYTARAVACFAFGLPTAVVDTNVRRVLQRLYPKRVHKIDFQSLADDLIPNRNAYDWNQALMDLGATICTARKPRCEQCPVKQQCPSAHRTRAVKVAKSAEPMRHGIPRRIYRGRIMDALMSRRSLSTSDLGHAILNRFSLRDEAWLKNILLSLENDGLVAIRRSGKQWQVALVA